MSADTAHKKGETSVRTRNARDREMDLYDAITGRTYSTRPAKFIAIDIGELFAHAEIQHKWTTTGDSRHTIAAGMPRPRCQTCNLIGDRIMGNIRANYDDQNR